jgi:hypothetical protein
MEENKISFPFHARCSYAEYIPSQVTSDIRVELLEMYWEKRDGLGTRFLCLAGRRIIYEETKNKTSLINHLRHSDLFYFRYIWGFQKSKHLYCGLLSYDTVVEDGHQQF